MLLLSIESSTKTASCALIKDGQLLLERFHTGSLAHSETLLGLVDELLRETGYRCKDIDLFAADIGPGSYTGIRIGVATVNALAFACGKKAVGVDSLRVLSKNVSGSLVCPMIDAKGGRVYAALYGEIGIEPFAGDIGVFLNMLPQKEIIFLGSGAYEHFDRINVAKPGAAFAGEEDSLLRAANVAYLAMTTPGQDELVPLYLQITQAERMKADVS